jgi:hypothetical protein
MWPSLYGTRITLPADLVRLSAGCTDDDDVWVRIDMAFLRLRSKLHNRLDAWALQAKADVAIQARAANQWVERWYFIESNVRANYGAPTVFQDMARTLYRAKWEYKAAGDAFAALNEAWDRLNLAMTPHEGSEQ